MTIKRDGGPAFPRPASVGTDYATGQTGVAIRDSQSGMSLRDWFAGQAPEPGIQELAGVLGMDEATPFESWDLTPEQRTAGVLCVREAYAKLSWTEKLAACAKYKYAHADAMLAARAENL